MDNSLINKIGFSEMYEWVNVPPTGNKLGRFVQFDENETDKIRLAIDENRILGVTTINSVSDSNNPEEWHYKYAQNEYGDRYLKKEKLAVGNKVYDQFEEMSYIHTRPWEHLIPIENEEFDKNMRYVPRTDRPEWIRVNLLGKVIVYDNGECTPGQYCKPYTGKNMKKCGQAIPATEDDKVKYYVLSRYSDTTILILNK